MVNIREGGTDLDWYIKWSREEGNLQYFPWCPHSRQYPDGLFVLIRSVSKATPLFNFNALLKVVFFLCAVFVLSVDANSHIIQRYSVVDGFVLHTLVF